LKLASAERTESKFGKKDIIYSAGLFDYVQTDGLKKIIHSLYSLLNEGGVLIAPFKDMDNYKTVEYHWFADWSYFYQRTIADVKNLLEEATGTKVEILKSGSPAINFFILRK
jgi:cyclopropane fatty-acyl-phospholipid synthase-like methyltransferase